MQPPDTLGQEFLVWSFALLFASNLKEIQPLPSPPARLSTLSSSLALLLPQPHIPKAYSAPNRTMPRQDPSGLTPRGTQDIPAKGIHPASCCFSLLDFKSLHPLWILTELGRAFLKIREDLF